MIRQARKNAGEKTYIEVGINEIDLFQYPGEIDVIVMAFNQDYRSNNYEIRYRKQQFWKKEDKWKIVYEGRVETP